MYSKVYHLLKNPRCSESGQTGHGYRRSEVKRELGFGALNRRLKYFSSENSRRHFFKPHLKTQRAGTKMHCAALATADHVSKYLPRMQMSNEIGYYLESAKKMGIKIC